jgi:hypothetical protein
MQESVSSDYNTKINMKVPENDVQVKNKSIAWSKKLYGNRSSFEYVKL